MRGGAGRGAGLVVEEEEEETEGLGGLRGGAALVRVEGAVDFLGTRWLAMEAEAEEMVKVDEVEVEGRDTAVGAFLTGAFFSMRHDGISSNGDGKFAGSSKSQRNVLKRT
jgi:hypothetical protein